MRPLDVLPKEKKSKNKDVSYFKNISSIVYPEVKGRYPDILKKVYIFDYYKNSNLNPKIFKGALTHHTPVGDAVQGDTPCKTQVLHSSFAV